ncbi:MAG TPA: hypothetical protein VL422_03380, partial [Miltoncostaea sp.]|nr:hypothetical protein [Miltoncostaea sp.]
RRALEESAGIDRVRPLIGDLQQVVHGLPAAAREPAPTSAGGGGGGGSAGDDDVVDAEYEE